MPPLLQLLVLMVLVMLLQPRPLIRPGEGGWASLDCPTGPADQRLGSKMAIGRSGRGRATSPARCRRRRRLRRTPCHAMPCRAMPTAPGRRMLWTWEPHERAGIGELLAAVRTRCQEKPQKETAGVGG